MKDYPYLFETHFHTDETSNCGHVRAKDGIAEYVRHGYAGVVVTDHYYTGFFERYADKPWEEACGDWLIGYRAAKNNAPKGFKVLLGIELRFVGSNNDYLVFGMDEDFLLTHPRLHEMSPATFSEFAKKNGLFFAQAHPFRGNCDRCDPALLDGIEVYNGNLRHNSHNKDAVAFAEENGKIQLSGSDFHEYEDTARGGMYLKRLPENEAELVKILFENDFILRKAK